ncbi:hypothetical protein PHYC_03039 [Phycisphaerales bacterium]|nr:hypothetical protein PHYC_03039 [Phycisphaerales bacterium]
MHARTLAVVVAALAAPLAMGGNIVFFTDHQLFTEYNQLAGKSMKGMEDFEESSAGPGEKHPFPNPLQYGVPRPTFPNGINSTNLIIQTNITPGPNPPTLNPSGDDRALWVNGAGFIGSNSIKVGTDEFLYNRFSSLDLIFTSHDKTGIGLEVSTYAGFNAGHGGFDMAIYDQIGNIIGTYHVDPAPPEPNKSFFGVWSATPIGRVNIWGIFAVPQPFAVDNIEMWVPAPGAGALLAMGGLLAARRRRR